MNIDAINTLFPWIFPLIAFLAGMTLLLFVVIFVSAWQNRRNLRQQQTLQNYVFPSAYFEEVHTRYPHLTESDVAKAFEQLRFYFTICWKKESKTVAMPSKIVDVCWHVFICDTRNYMGFCEDVYGRFLHHMPKIEIFLPQEVETDIGDAARFESEVAKEQRLTAKAHELDAVRVFKWAVTLQVAVQDGRQVSTDADLDMSVPLLFSIDRDMHIQDGYFYSPEVLQFLANYDLIAAESTAASLDSTEGGNLGAGCGDAGVVCGGCGGST